MNRYKISDPKGLYFLTLTVVDWVDVFIRKRYKGILIDSLLHCQQHKGLEICGFVIMTSHVHLLARAAGRPTLPDILRDFKKYTAQMILDDIQTSGTESRREWMLHRFAYRGHHDKGDRTFQFWQTDNHPIEVFSLPVAIQKLQYIHENPVKEGMVAEPFHYPYSSAANYFDQKGVLDISMVDIPLSWAGYAGIGIGTMV